MRRAVMTGLLMLSCCGGSPARHVYVLSPPLDPPAQVATDQGRPDVWLRPVLLPDYLDTTDIMRRKGLNEVKASTTGQWGERLSQGFTRALAAALAIRLPEDEVTLSAVTGEPARRILVNVQGFENEPDGRCVLTARWTVLSDSGGVQANGQASFVTMSQEASEVIDDAAVAAAMEGAIVQLAIRITDGAGIGPNR
jgi:uncharacterized protein